MIGKRVAASRCGTTSMYPRAGDLEVSTRPNTHTSFAVALPRWFYGVKTKIVTKVSIELHIQPH